MKAMEPIIKKHLPEIQAATDKAVEKAMYPCCRLTAGQVAATAGPSG